MVSLLSPRVARWVPRLVLSAFAILGTAIVNADPPSVLPFEIELTLRSTSAGTLQVFYDRGRGMSEAESVTTRIRASVEPVTYRLPIPAGDYRLFRIDPNDRGGRYVFTDMRVVTATGRAVADLPLSDLRAVVQAQLTTTAGAVEVVVPDGANDPQLLYAPGDRIILQPVLGRVRTLLGLVAAAVAGLLVAIGLERAPPIFGRPLTTRLARLSPPAMVAFTGIAAAALATYPLFIGRSLVSPNNGPTAFFYDEAPFVYGSADFAVENARGTDVGSIMWNILPYVVAQWDALAAGEIPLWNRYNAIGCPLWGQGQHFFLSPVHFAALALGDPSYYADAAFIAARMVFAAGVGLATFVASGSTLAGAFAAAAAPFIGYFSFRFNHPAYFSIVYAPWILLAYFRMAGRESRRDLVRAGVPLAMASALQLFGSTPKEGAVAFMAAHATGLLALALSDGTWRLRVIRIASAGLAVTLAVLIAAPHWLIFLDTLSGVYTAYNQPTVVYARWHEIAALALGTWQPGMPYPSLNGLVAVLAVATICGLATLRDRPSVLACAVGSGAFVALACGVIPQRIMLEVPLIANIHHTWNAFLSAALAPLLVTAGAALVLLQRAPVAGVAGATVGTILFTVAIIVGMQRPLPAIAAISLLPGMAIAALAAARRVTSPSAFVPVAIVVVLVALLPGGLHLETGVRTLDEVLLQPRLRADLDRTPPSVAAVRSRAGSEPFRVVSLDNVLFQGVQSFYRLEGIGGPDALELDQPRELSDAAGIHRTDWDWRTLIRKPDLTTAKGYFDMLGVRFVFARAGELADPLPMPEPDLVHAAERPSAWPRAFFVDGVRRHDSLEGFVTTLQASQAPLASADRSDAAAMRAVAGLPERERLVVPARNYHLTANRTSFDVDAPGAGLVVLTEAYMPGDFVVTLNGRRAAYVRINHAVKGVIVPGAGSWSIAFEYRPRLWGLAWTIALAAALAGATAILVSERASARARREPRTQRP